MGINPKHVSLRARKDVLTFVGGDDTAGHYYATLSVEVSADGEYRLAIRSSIARPSSGTYRLVVGVDAPNVLAGGARGSGPAFVFPKKDAGALERGVISVTGELTPRRPVWFYNLADLAAGQTTTLTRRRWTAISNPRLSSMTALTGRLPTETSWRPSRKHLCSMSYPGRPRVTGS
jgi:hypothetical protein